MIKTMPFLLFEGNCAEAMTFYQSCVGGDLSILRAGDTPMQAQIPATQHQNVVYAQLRQGAVEISGADWLHPVRTPRQGNTVGIYLTGGTYRELRALFDRLAEGSDPTLLDDLREMPFGIYGHLADKFGIHWFFRGDTHALG
jgi:PhnB protein